MKFFFLMGFALTSLAFGHPLDLGVVTLKVNGSQVTSDFFMNRTIATLLLEKPAENVPEVYLQSKAEELAKMTFASEGNLVFGGQPCTWEKFSATWEGKAAKVSSVGNCPGEGKAFSWKFPLMEDSRLPETFHLLIRVQGGGIEQIHTLQRGEGIELTAALEDGPSWLTYVWMGVEHIGMAPSEWQGPNGLQLPDGIDHILFLVALILGGGGMWQLIKMATGFTVGHSITLALASLGIVQLPGRLVESVIALSIAYVAAETLFRKKSENRWKVAALFGLVHGLGFANAITELQLRGWDLLKALLGYNVGVELGQVALVAILGPLVSWMAIRPRVRNLAVPSASLVIMVAGGFWFFQRALGL